MPRLGSQVRVPSSALDRQGEIVFLDVMKCPGGGMVDALVSGASGLATVQVRVLFWALRINTKCVGGGIGRHATLRG